MIKISCFFSLYFLLVPLCATLSPLQESVREMQQLLQNARIKALPEVEELEQIVRTEDGFMLLTQNYQIAVTKKYKENSFLGPKALEFYFADPEKR